MLVYLEINIQTLTFMLLGQYIKNTTMIYFIARDFEKGGCKLQ